MSEVDAVPKQGEPEPGPGSGPGSQAEPGLQAQPGLQPQAGLQPPPQPRPAALPSYPGRASPFDRNHMPLKSGTNGMAIASFAAGVFGGIPLGVIFGIVALGQIGDTRQKGKGFAVAGLSLSGVWTLVLVAAIVGSVHGEAHRSANGTVTKKGTSTVQELRVGDCAQDPGTGLLTEVTVVPCDQPHTAQVIAEPESAVKGDYPGDSAAASESTDLCVAALKTAVDPGKVTATMKLIGAHPNATAWEDGTRDTTCLLTDDKPFTGSVLIAHS